MPHLITQAEYSRHRGCSREVVRQAIVAGRISTVPGPNGRKMINPEEADIQWKKNTDQKQSARANASKRATEPAGASLPCSGCAVGFALGARQLAGATFIVATESTRGINETEGGAGASRRETFHAPDLARRAALGDFAPEVLAWLREGLQRHVDHGTPVDIALRLDRASRVRARDDALRAAADLLTLHGDTKCTVSVRLAAAVAYQERKRGNPSTPLETALAAAFSAGVGVPSTDRGLHRIIRD